MRNRPAPDPAHLRSAACRRRRSRRMPSETSSVTVFPISVAPASSNVCAAQACFAGTGFWRAQSWFPPPVGTPATSNRSLAAKLRPLSGPFGVPSTRVRGPGTKALMLSGIGRSHPLEDVVSRRPFRLCHLSTRRRRTGQSGGRAAGTLSMVRRPDRGAVLTTPTDTHARVLSRPGSERSVWS